VRRLVVAPECRNLGFGSALLEATVRGLTGARTYVRFRVPDDQTRLHLFLKARGFRAVDHVSWGDGENRDRYIFVHHREESGDGRETP
jgi:ribosomal protein S18 acetylase RimI-like enzyme